jgi:N-acylglucosamine-6-phosphate 2-epimerase
VDVTNAFERMRGGLVVSVQAAPGSPLAAPRQLAAIAHAVEAGGAAAIRAEGLAAVAAIREAVSVPVIGLVKRRVPDSDVYITPTLEDALAVAEAGAELVAVDATERLRADRTSGPEFVAALAAELPGRVVGDVDRVSAGRAAAAAGAAAVATTLSGYTGPDSSAVAVTPLSAEPDVALVAELAAELDRPVLAEGRYATPAHVRAAFDAGGFAVVVGTAITDPTALTRALAAATPGGVDDRAG